jgi:hypothetical protein
MVAACGIAGADEIISFTVTVPSTATDLTNYLVQLTAWDPGSNATAQDGIASDSTSYVSGQAGFVSGVTMASLDAANTFYNLQSYDILVKSTISGSFTVTNPSSNTATALGSAHLDSYTSVALGSHNSPALTSAADPSNDLFYVGGTPANAGGADPTTPITNYSGSTLAPGNSHTTTFSNRSNSVDLGDFYENGGGSLYTPITSNLSNVTSSDPLDFYISTLTGVDTNITAGNVTTTNSTTVAESMTVVYDFTSTYSAPPTPEPATMAMMGGALIGLGLLGKRLRKS